jgi:hypothetical protein
MDLARAFLAMPPLCERADQRHPGDGPDEGEWSCSPAPHPCTRVQRGLPHPTPCLDLNLEAGQPPEDPSLTAEFFAYWLP